MAALETVGDRVRRYRRLRKLTQDQLAEKSEVDRRQIGRLEAGEVLEPAAETLKRLAGALDIPIRSLAEPLGWYEGEVADGEWEARFLADPTIPDDVKMSVMRWIALERKQATSPPPIERPSRAAS